MINRSNKSASNSQKKNILDGMSYSFSSTPCFEYNDNQNKLTDSKLAPSCDYNLKTNISTMADFWVGFKNEKHIEIEFIFDSQADDLFEFELYTCLHENKSVLPEKMEVYAAVDDTYTLCGTHLFPKTIDFRTKYTARIALQQPVSAKKIKFVLSLDPSELTLIEEISAYIPGEEAPKNKGYFYPLNIPVIKEPTYWNDNDSAYNEYKNILLGLPYQTYSDASIEPKFLSEYFNMREDKTLLTNGIYADNTDYKHPQWYHTTSGFIRNFIFELENLTSAEEVKIGFLVSEAAWIPMPSWIEISVSENGSDWATAFREDNIIVKEKEAIIRFNRKFKKACRAKYINVKFRVSAHCWLDQIEIFGTKNISKACSLPEEKVNALSAGLPSPKIYGGLHEVLLAYVGNGEDKKITAEQYLPQVAYHKNGKITDWMFDSFLFLPNSSFKHRHDMLTKKQWERYTDILFVEDGNITALNEAVGIAKKALNDPDYKAPIIFSFPFPYNWVENFGSIDGKDLDLSDKEDRKLALRWFIHHQIETFENKNLNNLKIHGFYYHEEGIDTSEANVVEIVKETNEYVASLGYTTCWIPYYMADNFELWKEFGFTTGILQPNYAFDINVPKSRLYESIDFSKKYGLGIEIEVAGIGFDFIERTKEYYYSCVETNAMNDVIHMYYTGGMPGAVYDTYNSNIPYLKSMYDSTYKFIKGEFAKNTSGPDSFSFTMEKNTVYNGILKGDPADFVKYIDISLSPAHGTIRIEPDGSFEYVPNNNYTGNDCFEVKYNYGFTKSEPARIDINIKI
ncbi:DUF4855 domain-containing protein [Eubacteriales bacterium OttesenSCG-928-G02]|nr:DUF4855 domain-containing protein [Eubacteriales bacterium OttesenSCG-928-G02]